MIAWLKRQIHALRTPKEEPKDQHTRIAEAEKKSIANLEDALQKVREMHKSANSPTTGTAPPK